MQSYAMLGLVLIVLASTVTSGLLGGIIRWFESLFSGAKSVLLQNQGISKLTIYISSPSQYLLGLSNYTIISKTNTTVSVMPGTYHFQLGRTLTRNNTAATDLYIYNMTIDNTTAIIAVKPNDTIQWLNTGNGTFSIGRTATLLNQSGT
jgi:hypothetical protein